MIHHMITMMTIKEDYKLMEVVMVVVMVVMMVVVVINNHLIIR